MSTKQQGNKRPAAAEKTRGKKTGAAKQKKGGSTAWLLALLVVAVGMGAAVMNRGHIYDALIVHMTQQWYQLVIDATPEHARVLDVGIGTAAALLKNRDFFAAKDQHWVGVDYDGQYIDHARALLAQEAPAIRERLELHHISIYDYQPPADAPRFDVVYFASSLMIVPDPVKALQHAVSMLTPSGFIIVTQTIEKPETRSPFMLKLIETVKPFAKFFLTIDFGKITTEAMFEQTVAQAGLRITRDEAILNDGSLAGSGRSRFYKLERV